MCTQVLSLPWLSEDLGDEVFIWRQTSHFRSNVCSFPNYLTVKQTNVGVRCLLPSRPKSPEGHSSTLVSYELSHRWVRKQLMGIYSPKKLEMPPLAA